MVRKKPQHLPKLNSARKVEKVDESYVDVVRNKGQYSYNSLFVRLLSTKAYEAFGAERAEDILTLFQNYIAVENVELFLEPLNLNFDIGAEAYKRFPDNHEMFITHVITLMRLRQSYGCSDIDLTSVLPYYSLIVGKMLDSREKEYIYKLIRLFAINSITSSPNPFKIGILVPSAYMDFILNNGKNRVQNYRWFLKFFFECLQDCKAQLISEFKDMKGISLPHTFILVTSKENVRYNQILKLTKLFALEVDRTNTLFKNVTCLSEDSVEMNVVLDEIKSMKHLEGIDNSFVIDLMKKLENKGSLKSFSDFTEIRKYLLRDKKESTALARTFKLKPEFFESESFFNNLWKHSLVLKINCKSIKTFERLKEVVYAAVEILMLRLRGDLVRNNVKDDLTDIDEGYYLITLTDVKEYTKQFAEEVMELNKDIKSKHNKNIDIRIKYDDRAAMSLDGDPEPTHLRVISDIHADFNKDRHYVFNFGNDFVINCGDTAGSYPAAREWLRAFMLNGLVVAGNHLGYDPVDPSLDTEENRVAWNSIIHPDNTKTNQTKRLMSILQYETKFLSNGWYTNYGILFIGNTLYTDFKLFGEKNQAACMVEAARGMNDFKRCYIIDRRPDTRTLWETRHFTVEDHAKLFRVCLGYIKNRLVYMRRNKIKIPTVIVTHHCPLSFCVPEQFKDDPLSAAFASDLRWFIDEFPEIRLWCSGHTHTPYDFLYNETRFVCCPWGYFNENGFDEENYGKRIPIDDVKSNKSWRKILEDELNNGLVKDYGFGRGVKKKLADQRREEKESKRKKKK